MYFDSISKDDFAVIVLLKDIKGNDTDDHDI